MTETELYELLEGLRGELNGLQLGRGWSAALLKIKLNQGRRAVLEAARELVMGADSVEELRKLIG